jgi:hypothetical protein
MEYQDSIDRLEDFARDCISAGSHPDDDHRWSLFRCDSCHGSELRLTIEHHTGSEEWNFRGVIWGECSACGYLGRLFTFTGEHRELEREERPECDCGSRNFLTGMCERYEGEEGIPGFFDEGVVVGRCTECGLNRKMVYTD